MLINVPQYLDVEDKVAGPLTAKQLLWMIAMGVTLIILWNALPTKTQFFLIGIPATLIFIALAFYKPFGQPLPNFIFFGIMYIFKPKIYVWRRTSNVENIKIAPTKKKEVSSVAVKDKRVTSETLHDLATFLDSEGEAHNKNIEEWIEKHNQQKKEKKFF